MPRSVFPRYKDFYRYTEHQQSTDCLICHAEDFELIAKALSSSPFEVIRPRVLILHGSEIQAGEPGPRDLKNFKFQIIYVAYASTATLFYYFLKHSLEQASTALSRLSDFKGEFSQTRAATLTPRQGQILELMTQGMSAKQAGNLSVTNHD